MRVEIELPDLLKEAETQAWSYDTLAKHNRERAAGQEMLAGALRAAIEHSHNGLLTLTAAKAVAAVISPYGSVAGESAGQLATRLLSVLPPLTAPRSND